MSDLANSTHANEVAAAHEAGRRQGLATTAIVVAVLSFINMLGFEKSILAIILAALTMRGGQLAGSALTRSRIALIVGIIHVVVSVLVLTIFREEIASLLDQL